VCDQIVTLFVASYSGLLQNIRPKYQRTGVQYPRPFVTDCIIKTYNCGGGGIEPPTEMYVHRQEQAHEFVTDISSLA